MSKTRVLCHFNANLVNYTCLVFFCFIIKLHMFLEASLLALLKISFDFDKYQWESNSGSFIKNFNDTFLFLSFSFKLQISLEAHSSWYLLHFISSRCSTYGLSKQMHPSMSSSSLSSFLAPVFSCESWNRDVFLSFKRNDTRKTFVDHFYAALVQQGIYTYEDEKTFP